MLTPLALALLAAAADAPPASPPVRADAVAAPPAAAPDDATAAPPAADVTTPFVGTLHFDLQIQGQPAKASYVRSDSGDAAVEVRLKDPHLRQTIRTSLVVLSGNPDEAWQIMHQTRTFSRIALPAPIETARGDRFLVTKGQPETVSGRTVTPFHITDTMSGDELWVSLDPTLGELDLFDRLYRGYQPDAPSIASLVAAQGGKGFPVRFKFTKKSVNQTVEGTVSAVETGEFDEGVFAPPKGFIRVELPPGTSPIPMLSGPPSAKDVQSVLQGIMGGGR